ncbi:hypothetical protein [Streptomyces sp. BA2]|uniref:hypothetical protein n=1 Tax=Streptomyces sp. BA2 TaxID=436595 RepID=UPI001326313F|nr:hypothetical protein [Streptomyces sp. BA2]MWA16210.1 hypothetical protein [Streptomyces sp. BA2]
MSRLTCAVGDVGSFLATLLWRRDFADPGGDLSEGGHAEVHDGRPPSILGVQLAELLLRAGEADAEPFDFAEPSLAFRFGDPPPGKLSSGCG